MSLHTLPGLRTGNALHGQQEVPHHVSIMDRNNFKCAGSIINVWLIVTTAQCLQDKLPKNLQIIAGVSQRTRATRSNHTQIRDVQAFYTHDHFTQSNDSPMNDIGVILLNQPLEYTDYVQNITLPRFGEEFQGNASLVGLKYESSSGFRVSNRLKKVKVPIIPNDVCVKNYKDDLTPGTDITEIMCIGKSPVAKEDFGGGVVCYRDGSKDAVLCGVISCGECRGEFESSLTSVKVSRYLDWILKSKIKLLEKFKCRSDEFFCSSTLSCINRSLLCNEVKDCRNWEDETGCDSLEPCSPAQFRCKNGNCVPEKFACDGYNDCRDGSDEAKCPGRNITKCADEAHRCGNGRCIPGIFRCDKMFDCDDNSDEAGCFDENIDCQDGSDASKCLGKNTNTPTTCTEQEHRCGSGRCISMRFRCNQRFDCADKSDEADCFEEYDYNPSTIKVEENDSNPFTEIAKENDPNPFTLKAEETDYSNPSTFTSEENDYSNPSKGNTDVTTPEGIRDHNDKRYKCATDAFYCSAGCLNRTFVCDGKTDCEEGTDELNCVNKGPIRPCGFEEFRCDNGLCRSYSVVCDDHDDCGDSSDEMKCHPKDKEKCDSDEFQCDLFSIFRCIPSAWKCDGFLDCDDYTDEANCSKTHTVGKTSRNRTTTVTTNPASRNTNKLPACNLSEFHCENNFFKTCIPINLKCDGVRDCSQGEDEKDCTDDHDDDDYSEEPYPTPTGGLVKITLTVPKEKMSKLAPMMIFKKHKKN